MHTIKSLRFDREHPYDVRIVVPECEYSLWKDFHTCKVITVPDAFRSGDIREYILQSYPDDVLHVCIDDDLKFFVRRDGYHLEPVDDQDIDDMFHWIETCSYAHGAISAREGNNRVEDDVKMNTRAMRCLFYSPTVMLQNDIHWNAITCRMDFHVSLSLIEHGYPNAVNFHFAQNQLSSAASGGASHYRTKEMMDEQAYVLEKMHPKYVEAMPVTTKSSFGGGTRIDVRIKWQKAWEDAQCRP